MTVIGFAAAHAQAPVNAAESPSSVSPTKSLFSERAVEGYKAVFEAGTGAVGAYQKTRDLPSAAAITNARLRAQAVDYQSKLAQNGVERKGYEVFQAVRDLGLSFGGGLGNGIALGFRYSADRLVLGQLQKVEDTARATFQAAIRKLTDDQYREFRKDPTNYKPLSDFAKDLLDTSDVLLEGGNPEADRAALTSQVLAMGLRLGDATYEQMRQSKEDITVLQSDVKKQAGELFEMHNQLSSLSKSTVAQYRNLAGGVEELRMAQMDGVARAKYIDENRARLVDVYGEAKLKALQTNADAAAAREQINRGFDAAIAVTNGLAFFADKVLKDPAAAKAFSDVGKAVQVGKIAFEVFSAFSTGGLTAVMGGFQAMGALGSIFGGGDDSNTQQFAAMTARLDKIDQKLDELMAMQRKTMMAIERLSHQMSDLRDDLDDFNSLYLWTESLATKAAWKGYFGACLNGLVTRATYSLRGSPASDGSFAIFAAPMGELGELQWQQLHYLNDYRLRDLRTDSVGDKCYVGISELLSQPAQLLSLVNEADLVKLARGPTLSTRVRQQRELHEERVRWVRGFKQLQDPPNFDVVAPLLAIPVSSISAARTSWPPYGGIGNKSLRAELPCWWRAQVTPGTYCAGWNRPSQEALQLAAGRPLPVAEVLRLADTTLAFYPLAAYTKLAASGVVDETTLPTALSRQTAAGLVPKSQKTLLENGLRLVDAASTQAALANGFGLAATMADHVLAVSADEVPVRLDEKTCDNPDYAKTTYPNDGTADASVREYLDRNPALAQTVLRYVLHRIAFPEQPFRTDTSRALYFKVRQSDAPGFWPNNAFIPREKASDQIAKDWWLRVLESWAKPGTPVDDDDSKALHDAWAKNLLRFAYAGADKVKLPISVVTRVHENESARLDPDKATICRDTNDVSQRWVFTRDEIELPTKGWYIGVGSTFVPIPPVVDIRDLRLGVSPELVNLFQRRLWLLGERLSFDDRFSIDGAYAAMVRDTFRRNALAMYGM